MATAGSNVGGIAATDSTLTSITSTYPFTCNTCQVAFRSSEAQRGHMRSDWHRYNLKRRVASLPPLSSEIFTDKVLTAQASSNAAAAKASFERICRVCQKTYYSENAFQNHLGSQKHKLREATSQKDGSTAEDDVGSIATSMFSLGDPIDVSPQENKDADAEAEFSKVVNGMKGTSIQDKDPFLKRPSRPHHSSGEKRPEHPISQTTSEATSPLSSSTTTAGYPLSRCLFCNYDSPTWKLSVIHMTKIHGMFIPEQTYLTDLEGLVRCFHDKITEKHECLYCHKIKSSTAGIQTHMRDKGHCMIAFETEEEMIEVGQFYDFSSTYSDPEGDDDLSSQDTTMGNTTRNHQDSSSNGGAKLPTNDASIPDEEGWETDSSASSLDSEDLHAVPLDDHTHQYEKLPLHRHHSHNDPRPHRNADGFHSHAHSHAYAVFYSDYELHLPSGRTAGHRSLSRYYRQNLHNHPTPEEPMMNQRAVAEAPSEEDEEMEDANSSDQSNANNNNNRTAMTRANGGTGMLGVTEYKKREVRAAEKRGRRREDRERNRFQAGNEKRRNFQKHFRDPLLQ